jgi:uncharacterized protein involved in exopolysaccharide biosynthesis
MEEDFSLVKAIQIVIKKIRIILIASIVVALVTAGVSLMLPNYYEASSTFYAASPDLSAPTPISTSQQRINVYGNDEDLDRLLSIARSNQLLNYLIDSFNLYDHYEIADGDPKKLYKVNKKLLKHMNVLKTKYGAISLSVEDKDPVFAADMANASRNQISNIAQNLIKQSQQKTIGNYTASIADKETILNKLSDSLAVLRTKYGIIDAETQGEVLATSSADASFSLSEARATLEMMEKLNMPQDSINRIRARVAGLSSKNSMVSKNLKQFNEGISSIKNLENEVKINSDQISLMKERLSQLIAAYSSPFSSLHVVEEAITPVMKSRPRRSLWVIGAGMLTFVLMSLSLLLMDSLKKIDWS